MVAKLKTLYSVLFLTLLTTQGAHAENCRLSVSQSRIDYGVIRRDAQVETPSVTLGTRTLHLNVLCTEPSAIALRFIGPADTQGFQLGRGGRFRLGLKHAQLDGQVVEWETVHLPGQSANGHLLPGQVLVARSAGMPMTGRRLTAQVEVDAALPSDAFQVRSQTVLEGQGRFELVSPAVPPSR